MKPSQLSPLPEYFDRYILKNPDVSLREALRLSKENLDKMPIEKWEDLGDKVYEPGKWTIRDIMQHLIDTEWIFAYRALAFARGEKSVPSYDENDYALQARPIQKSLKSLVEELTSLRQATTMMFDAFDDARLLRSGMGFKGEYRVVDIGFIISGHQQWHFDIIKERYEPLLG